MRISLIGASSFLAKNIIDKIRENRAEVKLTLFGKAYPAMKCDFQFFPYNFPQVTLDTTQLLSQDVIIYCAGAGIQPGNKDSHDLIYEMNVFEPIRLINTLSKHDYTGQLLTFGSYFEIGESQITALYDEESFLKHTNLLPNDYCISKHLLSVFIDQKIRSAKLPFKVAHFILTNIYGPGENDKRLIPYLLSGLSTGQTLNLSAGNQLRQYTHIYDVSEFIMKIVGKPVNGIYHLTNPMLMSVKKLVETIRQIVLEEKGWWTRATFGKEERRDLSMQFLGLNSSKAMRELNWSPQIEISEGIKTYL